MGENQNEFVIFGGDYQEPKGLVSIGDVFLEYLKKRSDDKIVVTSGMTDNSWTAKEIINSSIKIAKSLYGADVRKNDVVAIISENRFEFISVTFGVFLLNAILAPINSNYSKRELKHSIELSKPKIIFVSSTAAENVLSLAKSFSFVKQIIFFEDHSTQGVTLKSFIPTNPQVNLDIYKQAKQPVDMKSQTAVIFLSSGTTGVAKGCEITQYNLIACISALEKRMKFLDSFDENIVTLNLTPWFHVMGFVNIYSILMSEKFSTVFLPRFDPKIFFSCIEKYKIISTSIPPPVVVFLSKTPLIHDYDLSSLKAIFCGAAPLKQETEELVKDLFKRKLCILQGYGMSETTAGIIYGVAGNEAPGSTGEPEEGIYVKIIDENGKSLKPHEVGEVCCKGNKIMKGYLNDPKATAETIDRDGWLHTGDLGYYDDKNRFYIVDRLKELIKYKGYQVPPAELEGLLLSNNKIKDCGVIGIPNDDAGELPFAFVVKQPNEELNEEEVKNFVKENASNAKRLRGGVKFIEEIPKNPSGKILRRELRDLYKSMKSKL